MISSVREFLKECPILKKGIINVNYLGDNKIKYTIDNVPCYPIVKRYADGGTLRQFIFVFASREAYDANVLQNMGITQFFDEFSSWIEQQNEEKNFPVFPEGSVPTAIEVLSSGYLMSSDEKTARFQMQLKITYRKERMF